MKDPTKKTARKFMELGKEIESEILQYSKCNINEKRRPKKGETIFSQEVSPDKLKINMIRLYEACEKFDKIKNN